MTTTIPTSTDSGLVTIKPACPVPCAFCPWRLSNQGQKHPHKFYTPANLRRLWKGLRNGARMSCHPTDPRMAEFEGYEALADREVTHECAGAVVLVQREFMVFQDIALANPKSRKALQMYTKQRPNGMTRNGLISIAERAIFGGTMLNPVAMSKPDLSNQDIGYPAVDRPPR